MKCKRILTLTLAAALAVSLTACGSKGDESASQDTAAGVAVQTETVAARDIATDNKVSGKVAADSQTSIMVAAAAKCTAAKNGGGAFGRGFCLFCRCWRWPS